MHNLFWSVLILFVIATLLRLDWVYYLVYVVGGVWLFSHWWIRRSFRRLTIQRDMLHNAFVGEKIPVQIKLVNHSWLPLPWLLVEEHAPLDLKDSESYRNVISLGGKATLSHPYLLYCKKRGYYEVGPLTLHTGDLFGFAEAGWHEASTTHVTVYPQVVPLHELGLPSRSPFGVLPSRSQLFEDPNRMAGVRSYVTGDNMRRIHWKASAHENELLVKKFQPAIALNVSIVLDLNRKAYPLNGAIGYSEWAIVIAASVASHITQQRQPVGLICNGLDSVSQELSQAIPSHQGQGQLMNILSSLARVQMHEFEHELAAWLPRRINDLEWGTTLVVVTPKVDEALLWVLHDAYRRGSSVTGLVCAPQANFNQMRAQAGQLGVKLHRTVWEKDLHAVA